MEFFLRLEAADLFLELLDALAQLRLLADARAAAQLEQLALAIHDAGNIGIVGLRQQIRRKLDAVGTVALAFQPRLARGKLGQALGDDGEIGAGHGVVEAHQDLPRLDAVAVVHQQFADDAAGRVLHLLDVGIDDDLARRDDRAGQLHRSRPAADADGEHDDDDEAGHHVVADRSAAIPKPAPGLSSLLTASMNSPRRRRSCARSS